MLASTHKQEEKDEPCHDWYFCSLCCFRAATHIHIHSEKCSDKIWHFKINMALTPITDNKSKCVAILIRQCSSTQRNSLPLTAFWGQIIIGITISSGGTISDCMSLQSATHSKHKQKKRLGWQNKEAIWALHPAAWLPLCVKLPLPLNPAFYNSYRLLFLTPLLHSHSLHRPKRENKSHSYCHTPR